MCSQCACVCVVQHTQDPPKKHATSLNPLLLFDYRCHAPGGAIGFNYPDKLKQCLKDISAMTVDNVQVGRHG